MRIKRMAQLIVVSASALLPASVSLVAKEMQTKLGDKGVVSYDMPDGWQHKVFTPKSDFPPTIMIDTNGLKLKITIIWEAEGAKSIKTPEELSKFAEMVYQKYAPTSVEGKVIPKAIKTAKSFGSYASFTDKKLVGKPIDPNDFKCMTLGFIRTGDLTAGITLLSNDLTSAEYQKAINIIKSIIKK